MPASAILLSLFLMLFLLAMFCGFIGSWAWAISRVRAGEPLVPRLVEPPLAAWGLGSIVLVILTWLIVNLAVVSVYAATTRAAAPVAIKVAKPDKPKGEAGLGFTEQMAVVSVSNVVLLLAIPLLLRTSARARLIDLGLTRRKLGGQIMVGTVGFFLVAPFVYAVNGLAVLIWQPEKHPLEKMVRNESALGIAELAILSAVILAPVTEELIFRGVIQRWLTRLFSAPEQDDLLPEDPGFSEELALQVGEGTRAETPEIILDEPVDAPIANPYSSPVDTLAWVPPRPDRPSFQPIVMTSFLFATVHYPQWPAPVGIFLLSLGLGYVAERSGSLISAMVMHALFNGLGTFLLLVVVQLGSMGLPAKKLAPPPAWVISEQMIIRLAGHFPGATVPHLWGR